MIDNIKQTAAAILPKGSTLYLYGSRARGDSHNDSDWDLLILLDKPCREKDDWDKYAWPFVEKGLDRNELVSVQTYTKDMWFNGPHSLFFYNVEEDKEVLYES
jgi:predicted nucleotidyltransferase